MINAGVGADKALFMFDNDQARTGADDLIAFLQDQLDDAWVFMGLLSKLKGARARLHIHKTDKASLRLADDLLREDEDITIHNMQVGMLTGLHDDPGEVVAFLDQGDIGQGSEGERIH